jgi:hypothetical protein
MMVMQYLHIVNAHTGRKDVIIPLPFFEGTMAVLGLLSLLLNILFIFICVITTLLKKSIAVPKWLVWVNFIILATQVYWLFIDKSK